VQRFATHLESVIYNWDRIEDVEHHFAGDATEVRVVRMLGHPRIGRARLANWLVGGAIALGMIALLAYIPNVDEDSWRDLAIACLLPWVPPLLVVWWIRVPLRSVYFDRRSRVIRSERFAIPFAHAHLTMDTTKYGHAVRARGLVVGFFQSWDGAIAYRDFLAAYFAKAEAPYNGAT
jgi:hypothetical protein